MPFDFVNGLKDGKWIKLDKQWLQVVQKTLKQAVSNSIKDIKLVCAIMYENLNGKESIFFSSYDCHIYQVNNVTHLLFAVLAVKDVLENYCNKS
jgi:hypothetical protein